MSFRRAEPNQHGEVVDGRSSRKKRWPQYDHMTVNDFSSLVRDKRVVVQFFADWCTHCQEAMPIFDAMTAEFPQAVGVKINAAANPPLRTTVGVEAYPTFQVWEAGALKHSVVGLGPSREGRVERVRALFQWGTE